MRKTWLIYFSLSYLLILMTSDVNPAVVSRGDSKLADSLLTETTLKEFNEDSFNAEFEIKKMIRIVGPLMSILNSRSAFNEGKRSNMDMEEYLETTATNHAAVRNDYGNVADYSNYGGYSSGSCVNGCCNKDSKLVSLFSFITLGLLFLYLVTLTATTTIAGRRRREDDFYDSDTIDASTWLSTVNELWRQDHQSICTQKKLLCEINYRSLRSTDGGWTVYYSSLPLSYLLHERYGHGFLEYLDASMLGRSGTNCAALFNNCTSIQ